MFRQKELMRTPDYTGGFVISMFSFNSVKGTG